MHEPGATLSKFSSNYSNTVGTFGSSDPNPENGGRMPRKVDTRLKDGVGNKSFSTKNIHNPRSSNNGRRKSRIHRWREIRVQRSYTQGFRAPAIAGRKTYQKHYSKPKSKCPESLNMVSSELPADTFANDGSNEDFFSYGHSNTPGYYPTLCVCPLDTNLLGTKSILRPTQYRRSYNQQAVITSTPNIKPHQRSPSTPFYTHRNVTAPAILCQDAPRYVPLLGRTPCPRRDIAFPTSNSNQQARNPSSISGEEIDPSPSKHTRTAILSDSPKRRSIAPLFYDYSEEFETDELDVERRISLLFDADGLASWELRPPDVSETYHLGRYRNSDAYIPETFSNELLARVSTNGIGTISEFKLESLEPREIRQNIDDSVNSSLKCTLCNLIFAEPCQSLAAMIDGHNSTSSYSSQGSSSLVDDIFGIASPQSTQEIRENGLPSLKSLTPSLACSRDHDAPSTMYMEKLMSPSALYGSQDGIGSSLSLFRVTPFESDSNIVPEYPRVKHIEDSSAEYLNTSPDLKVNFKRSRSVDSSISEINFSSISSLFEVNNKTDDLVSNSCDISGRTPLVSPTLPDEVVIYDITCPSIDPSSTRMSPSPSGTPIRNPQLLETARDSDRQPETSESVYKQGSLKVLPAPQYIKKKACGTSTSQSEPSILSPKPISLVEQSRLKNSIPHLTKLVPSKSRQYSHSTVSIQDDASMREDHFLPFQISSSTSLRGPIEGKAPGEEAIAQQVTRSIHSLVVQEDNNTHENEIFLENRLPSVPSKFKLKRHKTLISNSITEPDHKSESLGDVKSAKMKLKNIHLLSGYGTVRVKRQPKRASADTCWRQSRPLDLFTAPSELNNIFRKVSDQITRRRIISSGMRTSQTSCSLPCTESVFTGYSNGRGGQKLNAELTFHFSEPVDSIDSIKAQSYYSKDSGCAHKYQILGKKLLHTGDRVLAPFTAHETRHADTLPTKDTGQAMSKIDSEQNKLFRVRESHPKSVRARLLEWIRRGKSHT
ncbi:hypothetical protein F5884DRAFT_851509 [Xylogone sp. PMI_703]|nr:hypothetical protein F5884DRAFT_851509 [Xylogone sp. PMI_703]